MLQLLVIASLDDAQLLRDALEPLKPGSGIRFVTTIDAGLNALREQPWDAIILTIVGSEAGTNVPFETYVNRAHGAPVFAVVRDVGEDGAVELMHRGAADVVSFSRIVRLPEVLQRELRTKSRIVAHRQTSKTAHSWFASIVNHIPVGIVYHNERGEIVLCNETALELLGLTEEEYLGRTPLDPAWNICHENGKPFPGSELPATVAAQTKQPVHNVFMGVFRPKTNDRVWLRVDAVPVLDDDGRLAHVVVLSSDITKQRQMSEKLRSSEERFRSAFEYSGIGLFLASLDLQILQANATATRIFRRSTEEIVGKYMHELTHPEDVAASAQHGLTLMNPGAQPISFEKRYFDGSGNLIWAVVTLNVIRDSRGNPQQFIVAIQDITARKQAEAERKRLETQLLQAKKLEALGILAGGVAHDFNNILAAILCSADVLLHDLRQIPNSGEMPEIVFELQTAAQRGADLVRQILTFGRRSQQKFAPLKLTAAIHDCLDSIKKNCPPRIEVHLDVRSAPSILADASQIQQVLLNLCQNAFYSFKGASGNVTIELDSVVIDPAMAQTLGSTREGPHAHLRIRDDGTGMDAHTLEHVFEPFLSGEAGRGSGLGMAVVHGIVATHDGIIRVQSAVERGTTVDIWIPAVTNESAILPQNKMSRSRGNNEHILIIDDEESLARVFGRLLQGLGYQTTVQTRSANALELFDKDPDVYDAALVDLHMPNPGGLEVAKHLHASRPNLPIFIMSGYSDALSDTPTESLGIVGILQKPVTRDTLVTELRKAFERRSPF
jgi:PAS domain S-box-containing protein